MDVAYAESGVSVLRQLNGCLTCRDRKKRCDQNYPVCDACRRLNFVCRREDPRHPRRPGRPKSARASCHSASLSIQSASPCVCLSTRAPDISAFWLQNGHCRDTTSSANDHVAQRRLVLRYYTQGLAALITTNQENNCFLSVFMPLAMDSPLFLDTILAWSATHLALGNTSYEPLALRCRGAALRSLAASLASATSVQRQPEAALACCLVQCALESISGDTRQWHTHVEGAHQVIRSVCGGRVDGHADDTLDLQPFRSFEGRWLLRSFAYHDIMATVSENRKPLIVAGHYWLFDEEEPPDSLFGLASKILFLISETSILNVDLLAAVPTSRAIFVKQAQDLEADLMAWQGHAGQPADLLKLAEMYQNAALIHLYRTMRHHQLVESSSLQAKIDAAVNEIVDRLQCIPEKCLVEGSLLFPVFMAGGETSNPAFIETIRARMQDIIDYRHFHNFVAALDVLEELWHFRLMGREIDWRQVLDRKQWMLSIT